jgi:rubrerythrin
MAGAVHGRVKRINAEFRGDEAVEIDILEVALRMADVARTRAECDTKLVRLALRALDRTITQYCSRTAQRYPGYAALARFMDEQEATEQAEPARVVSMQK